MCIKIKRADSQTQKREKRGEKKLSSLKDHIYPRQIEWYIQFTWLKMILYFIESTCKQTKILKENSIYHTQRIHIPNNKYIHTTHTYSYTYACVCVCEYVCGVAQVCG